MNKQIDISAAVSSGNASAIATAINEAIAENVVSGADMSGVATASVSGNVVTLMVHDGSKSTFCEMAAIFHLEVGQSPSIR